MVQRSAGPTRTGSGGARQPGDCVKTVVLIAIGSFVPNKGRDFIHGHTATNTTCAMFFAAAMLMSQSVAEVARVTWQVSAHHHARASRAEDPYSRHLSVRLSLLPCMPLLSHRAVA